MSESQINLILQAIAKLDKRFDSLDNKVDEISESVRKLLKFIPVDNADFTTTGNGKQTKKKPVA